MSRHFLITKFVCAKCGALLNLASETPKFCGRYAEGEPTGAQMVEQFVAVEPCAPCAAPLEIVRDALRALQTVGGAA
jgi:hypothetical protein